MQSRRRRFAAAAAGVCAATLLAMPSASADLVERGWRKIQSRFLLHAGRFDDYCEHRRVIEKGDTLESMAAKAYGDRTRATEIAAANPDLDPSHLVVGRKIVLPAKSTQPSDAKETLAWTFWGYTSLSGYLPLQRVYPDDPTDPTGSFFHLFAVSAANAAEVARLLEDAKAKNPKAGGVWAEDVLSHSPFAVPAKGIVMQTSVRDVSAANESTTVVRIVELVAAAKQPGRFQVESESVEFRDRGGKVVKAGFGDFFSVRGMPLVALALIGAIGLIRMRRRRETIAS